MSSPRAYANQALYLSRIVLAAWRDGLAAEQLPAATLRQAFLPAVCAHLQRAHGWFLLELAGLDSVPEDGPPRSSKQLPDIAPGKAESGELREVRQLESNGFIAEFLAESRRPDAAAPAPRVTAGLATTAVEGADIDDVIRWVDSFGQMCDRMRNSLDEC